MTWQVAASDYAECAVLLPLLGQLLRAAPAGVRVAVRRSPALGGMLRQLESGTIDLGLFAMESVPDRLHHRILFKELYVLVARKRHPALEAQTHRGYAYQARCVVSYEEGGFKGVTDAALRKPRPKAARGVVRAALSLRP